MIIILLSEVISVYHMGPPKGQFTQNTKIYLVYP